MVIIIINTQFLTFRKAAAVLGKHPTKLTSGSEAKKLVIININW